MANNVTLRGNIKIKSTLPDGTGDEQLTLDPVDKSLGKIPNTGSLSTSLLAGRVYLGNSLDIATPTIITGAFSLNPSGVAILNDGVVTNQNISAGAGILYSKLNLTGGIINADINSGAGIAKSKLEIGTINRVLINNASGIVTEHSAIVANRLLISNGVGLPTESVVTATEASYLSGVTSPLQAQFANKLTFSSGISPLQGDLIYYNGTAWVNFTKGTSGQYLTSTLTGLQWVTVPNGVPTGGLTNQYLKKNSATDFDTSWDTLQINDITDITASAAQINVLSTGFYDATSSIQTQLTGKQNAALSLGAIWVGNSSGIAAPLTVGTNGHVLTVVAGVPTWQAVAGTGTVTSISGSGGTTGLTLTGGPITSTGTLTIGGTLGIANGGTNITSYTTGDILYASATNVLSKLPAGTNTYVLTMTGGVPVWAAPSGGGGVSLPFADNVALLKNNADNTKTAKFDLSNISTSTLRTYTLPNLDGTLALTSTFTASNGITKTGNDFSLGGSFSTVNLNSASLDANGYQITGGSTANNNWFIGAGAYSYINSPTSGAVEILSAASNVSNTLPAATFAGHSGRFGVATLSNSWNVYIESLSDVSNVGKLSIIDNRTVKKGLEYFAAYTADILGNNRSIPDIGIVKDGTYTFTNKTISGASNTLSNISLTSSVTGVLPVANGGTNRNALGSALQVLRVNAGGTDTEWATIGGGGSPAGINTELQLNNSGAFGGADITATTTVKTLGLSTNAAATQTLTVDGSTADINIVIQSKALGTAQIIANGGVSISGSVSSGTAASTTIGGISATGTATLAGQLNISGASSSVSGTTGGIIQISAGSATTGTAQGGDLRLQAGVGVGGSRNGFITFNQPVNTGGTPTFVRFVGGANTTLTATVESPDIDFVLDRIVQFNTGAITTQRSTIFRAPTYSFVAASTITNAATVAINGAPVQGTNATITNAYALWIQAGATAFGGDVVGTAATQNLFNNATVTTLNFGGSATTWTVGATTGTFTLRNTTVALSGGTVTGAATQNVFNTTSTTVNAFGAATTATIFGTSTAAVTYNIGTNATATATTKAINIGTAGASGSTTNITLGSAVAGSTSVITYQGRLVSGIPIRTSTSAPVLQIITPADTTLTLSVESIFAQLGGTSAQATVTRQWATGALTTQREVLVVAPTYGFVAASTLTNAATFAVNDAPIAGTNATITNRYSIWAQAGNVRFDGTETQVRHLRGTTSAPTIAAGTGAGTTPTVSVTGTDAAGIVNVTTGTTPTGTNAIVVTITFNTAYTVAPYVILTPANRNAQALAVASQVLVPAPGQTNGVTTTTFVIESGATALAASTAYIWSYHVIQ